jgi:hypothetical protein
MVMISKEAYARMELTRYYTGLSLNDAVEIWLAYFNNRGEDIRDWNYCEEVHVDQDEPWKVGRRLVWKRR